jgi:uncharacterized membrane protein
MTCIAGIAQNGNVYMGGDSAAIGGWNLTIRKDRKVFRNGDFLIGGTSSFRMLQLLHHAFVPPVYDPAIDIEKFMATTFIDAIRQCFKDGGYAKKTSEEESGGQFLVGFRGHLFDIQPDYQVQEALDDYDAVGCGVEVALGSLYASGPTQDGGIIDPRRRVAMALEAAQHHNAGLRGPFYVEVLEVSS